MLFFAATIVFERASIQLKTNEEWTEGLNISGANLTSIHSTFIEWKISDVVTSIGYSLYENQVEHVKNQQNSVKKSKVGSPWWAVFRKHGFSIMMGFFVVMLFVSPDFKSWTMRQLMHTGLFNASIEHNKDRGASLEWDVLDFSFEDETGNVRQLSSLKGKVVFINFWASWCPPCRAEFPSIQALYSRFDDHPDLFFLMINEDRDRLAAMNFLQKEGYENMPMYRSRGPVPEEIYSGTLPTTVIIDKNGYIRMHRTGFTNYGSRKFQEQMEGLMGE